jgi:ribonuclease HI
MKKDKIVVFNSGCCINNPGYGTWNVFVYKNHEQILTANGSDEHTTTNTMELRAVLESFKLIETLPIDEQQSVVIYNQTDYVKWSLNSWVQKCLNNGMWTTNSGKPIHNTSMWIELTNYLKKHPSITICNISDCSNVDYITIMSKV